MTDLSIGGALSLRSLFSVILVLVLTGTLLLPIGLRTPLQAPERPAAASRGVVLLVVDSLMPEALNELLREDQLKAIPFLIRHGFYWDDMVSVFPTMSVVIDSTLLTGSYPDEHGIPALVWYDPSSRRVVNYGDSPRSVGRQGLLTTLNWTLIDLNQKHLNSRVTTIHEMLERTGRRSASINLLVHRGIVRHALPLTKRSLSGPHLLALGPLISEGDGKIRIRARSFRDADVWPMIRRWLHRNPRPDLLIAYLSDLDKKVHREGPGHRRHLLEIDRRLSNLLSSFGSWEDALDRYIFIMVGDSGHAAVKRSRQYQIHLEDLLKGQRLLPPGSVLKPGKYDWIVAPNEQLAILYPVRSSSRIPTVCRRLLEHPGVDLVIRRKGREITVRSRKGSLRFQRGGPWTDPYGGSWSFTGNPEVLDLQIHPAAKRIGYRSYPDAFRQILGATGAQRSTSLLVTAREGYEFRYGPSPSHPGGGSHGSLKRREMLVPLIAGGTSDQPKHRRIVDLKAWIQNLITGSP